jgi:hypothetical protein
VHPVLHKRILEDVRPFAKAGITEDMILKMSRQCITSTDKVACGDRMIQFMVSDGKMYLNNVLSRRSPNGPESIVSGSSFVLGPAQVQK